MGAKKITVEHTCEIIHVDFSKRTKTKVDLVVSKKKALDMSGFNPPQGNFEFWSEEELVANSEHILKHIHELSIDDVIHFINVGSLDKKKVANLFNLQEQ